MTQYGFSVPRKLLALLTLASALGLPFIGLAAEPPGNASVGIDITPWKTESWGEYPGHSNHPRVLRTMSLDSGTERYTLQYSYCSDPSHAPNVATPEGYIGMPGPPGWYANGFLAIEINGKDIGLTKPLVIHKLEDGERGSVQIVWDREDVQMRATFLLLPEDTTLYAEVAAFPKTPLQSIKLHLISYPAAYTSQGDRWAVTASRTIEQVKKVDLDSNVDRWIICEDRKCVKGIKDYVGGCGALYLPEEVASGNVEVSAYPIVTHLTAKPGVKRLHLALWDFYNKTNPEAEAFMKVNADRIAAALRQIDFACRYLRAEAWREQRADIQDLLSFVKDRPALADPVNAVVKEIDGLQAQIAALTAAGKPVKPATEDRVLEDLDKLQPKLWELRFAKLFAE